MKNHSLTPPPTDLPILTKLSESYKLWHNYLTHLPKLTKYSLGVRVDNLFADCLELSLYAGYADKKEKLIVIKKLSVKFDALKFFLKLLWEIKALDNKQFAGISAPITEVGKMIGGWLKLFKTETPPN